MEDHPVRSGLSCSSSPCGGLRRRLVRVLAVAVCPVLLTLPAIVSSAPALAAGAAAKQQGAFAYGTGARGVAPAVDAAGEGGISGTVTAAAGGARLSGVDVEVWNGSGDHSEYVGSATTGADGTYRVTGLAPLAPGYVVCFDGSDATGGSSSAGYLGQCYRNVPWAVGDPALGATPVPVMAGRLTPAVDATLNAAGKGGVSGTGADGTRRSAPPAVHGVRLPLSGGGLG